MKKYYFFIILILFGCEKNLFEDKSTDPIYNFDCFWHEVDRNYPFFPYTNLNWDSIYKVYRPLITPNTTNETLFGICSQMLDLLNDAHTSIYTPLGIGGNIRYFNKFRSNQIALPDSIFETYTTGKVFEYGELKSNNIGYLKIKTFDGEKKHFEEIDTILDGYKTTIGLIIDVRSNQGGNLNNIVVIASRLADTTRFTTKQRTRNGIHHNDFSAWVNYYISPTKTGVRYNKPVIILTNRMSYSATEWFVLYSRTFPKVTVIGDITGGGSSPVLVRELPNSWILRTSNSQMQTTDGNDFQYTGLYPDIKVSITPTDEQKNIDTILEKAIEILTNPE